jgi:hypothetical protein
VSVDHSFKIGRDESTVVSLNLAGLDREARAIDGISPSIYAYGATTGEPIFTCRLSVEDLRRLFRRLESYRVVTDSQAGQTGRFVEIEEGAEELSALLSRVGSEKLIPALRHLVAERLTETEINTILGRRDALESFASMIAAGSAISEREWQEFFEANSWIFGYGLRYAYLRILQREARLAKGDLAGGDVPIADFLLSDSKFTKLVELKRPSTPLFEATKNRARSWRLSGELTDAVSQILAQKASWELQANEAVYDSHGTRIREQIADVECILIVGSRDQITGTEQEVEIKLRTLELFRRNLRNLEVVLYDELLERARFIVGELDDEAGI